VLDLTDIADNRIIPAEFFEENYLTEGMKILIETAFLYKDLHSPTHVFLKID
jgi:hypothetical protein